MKEKDFINIIKEITHSQYIGDDCAYLKEFGIVITQDNLVEDVHFSLDLTTPYKLGYKSAMVNISDILASGAEPKYLTVGLSMPKNVDESFVREFYNGIKSTGIEVAGGDITGGDKVFISICAIGDTSGRKISSRANAKEGYKIITSGFHGSSSAGLKLLQNGIKDHKFVQNHLMPQSREEFSKYIAQNADFDYAMTDSSDGLYDALLQIAEKSHVKLSINSIPYDKEIEQFEDYTDLVLFGGEDYELVACVPKSFNVPNSYTIGEVKFGDGVEIFGKKCEFEEKIFNHFKE